MLFLSMRNSNSTKGIDTEDVKKKTGRPSLFCTAEKWRRFFIGWGY